MSDPPARPLLWYRPNTTFFLPEVEEQIVQLNLEAREFDWNTEIVDTPYAHFVDGMDRGSRILQGGRGTKMRSNWIRLLLLYKYGGVWFDSDVMMLHPIQDIIREFGEFVSEWGQQPHTNNCFMYFQRRSDAIAEIIQASVEQEVPTGVLGLIPLQKATVPYGVAIIPIRLTEFCWETEWCDPGFVFDDPSFVKPRLPAMIRGCVIWHWHNRWLREIGNHSLFAELEMMTDWSLGLDERVTTAF
jgi:hypothetical protein